MNADKVQKSMKRFTVAFPTRNFKKNECLESDFSQYNETFHYVEPQKRFEGTSEGIFKMSTIKDVAKYTGLSLGTISKYLNGGNVREENRVLIDDAVRSLGFRVNRNARSLKTNKTMTVGVVIPTISIPFFGSVIQHFDAVMREAGYSTFICSYDFNRELELEKLRFLANNNVDGIVLAPESIAADELDAMRSLRGDMPFVLIDRIVPGFKCDSVVVDNRDAVKNAVEHLISLGHTRIGLLAGPDDMSTGDERTKGYIEALKNNGITVDSDYINVGKYDYESGHRGFMELMNLKKPPTAILANNYDTTLGSISASYEKGLTLGYDIGFVGFDATEVARAATPRLTVVEQPTELMGKTAARMLLKRLGGDMKSFPEIIRLKTRLVTGHD